MRFSKNTTIGIVGAGAMGLGIAQVAATAGHKVVVFDNIVTALEKAKQKLATTVGNLLSKGKIDAARHEEILGNVTFAENIQSFLHCGLVIEAIVENLSVKNQVLSEIDQITPSDCVIASNTSSLSITALAAACEFPHLFIGIHFFNPAPLMPLVEIIPGYETETSLVEEVRQLMLDWGKVPVIAKDTPGFIVNRVARPFYGESIRILEENIANKETIDWALKTLGGFRMGPFELMDFIGMDVNFAVTQTVYEQFFFDPRYRPSLTQQRLVQAKRLGRKSGKGFYEYAQENGQQVQVFDKSLVDSDSEKAQQIFERVLAMLINEAAEALYLQIATREDIDLAMTKGVNYPKGLLAWADEIGISKVVSILDGLYDLYHEDRYRVSPWLDFHVRIKYFFSV